MTARILIFLTAFLILSASAAAETIVLPSGSYEQPTEVELAALETACNSKFVVSKRADCRYSVGLVKGFWRKAIVLLQVGALLNSIGRESEAGDYLAEAEGYLKDADERLETLKKPEG